MRYTVVVTKDPEEEKDVYNASVAGLPGVHTWGKSIEEAVQNAKECAEVYMLTCRDLKDPIPHEVATATISVRNPIE